MGEGVAWDLGHGGEREGPDLPCRGPRPGWEPLA